MATRSRMAGGRRVASGWAKRRRGVGRVVVPALLLGPVVLYALAFFAYPLVFGVEMSVENFGFGALIHGSGPFVGLANYGAVIRQPVTLLALRNTVIFTVASVGFQVAIGLGLATLFNRRFLLSGVLRRFVLVPWLIPLLASGTVFSILFGAQGGFINIILEQLGVITQPIAWLVDTTPAIIAIILVNIWAGIPFNAIVLYSGLQDIDAVFYEAATIDGAGAWHKFRWVTLPLLRPVMLIVVMLGIIATVKVFDIVWVMTGAGPDNATQLLSTWAYTQSFTNFNFGQGAAIGNILLVISMVLALFYLRSLRRQG